MQQMKTIIPHIVHSFLSMKINLQKISIVFVEDQSMTKSLCCQGVTARYMVVCKHADYIRHLYTIYVKGKQMLDF